jgi:acyl dehydratase/NAD(P)-dependent dehydrogenase (short-subunit alcohol dehydrogenase family)
MAGSAAEPPGPLAVPGQAIILGSRSVTAAEQDRFAALAADRNPIHIDAAAARRSIAGSVVVHGAHTLLWGLDLLAGSAFRPAAAGVIDARFAKPLYLDEEAECRLEARADGSLMLRVQVGEKPVATILVGSSAAGAPTLDAPSPALDTAPLTADARESDLAGVEGERGVVLTGGPGAEYGRLFPQAASLFGEGLLRDIGGCSRLVGMVCPGRWSLLSRLTVFPGPGREGERLAYQVTEYDDRFRLLRIDVGGSASAGRIEAFSPPPPVAQAEIASLAAAIVPGEFAGQTALVVGGSRGLGALTAKLLAAGGAEVHLTYASGKEEAEALVAEIAAHGGRAACHRLDLLEPDVADRVRSLPPLTHLYHFATRPIFQAKRHGFDPALLESFTRFYVTAFFELCEAAWRARPGLRAFYPSSVAVSERPKELVEYAMAKAAGELLCQEMPRLLRGMTVTVERLPRLLTDQTASVVPQSLPEAAPALLAILRKMNAAD